MGQIYSYSKIDHGSIESPIPNKSNEIEKKQSETIVNVIERATIKIEIMNLNITNKNSDIYVDPLLCFLRSEDPSSNYIGNGPPQIYAFMVRSDTKDELLKKQRFGLYRDIFIYS